MSLKQAPTGPPASDRAGDAIVDISKVPDFALCPVTHDVLIDPVTVDGDDCRCIISRQAAMHWIQKLGKATCPVDGGRLRTNRIFPDTRLRESIEHFLASVNSQVDSAEGNERATSNTDLPSSNDLSSNTRSIRAVTYEQGLVIKYNQISGNPSIYNPSTYIKAVIGYDHDTKFATAGNEGTLIIRDVGTGNCLQEIRTCSDIHCFAELGDEEKHLVSGHLDSRIYIWDVSSGRRVKTFIGHAKLVYDIFPYADGTKVISASGDGTLKIWEVASGRCLRTLNGHTGGVTCVKVFGNWTKAVSGSWDCSMRIWNLNTGECIQILTGHGIPIVCLAVVDNGTKVVSGSTDNSIKIWDVATGRCLKTCFQRKGKINIKCLRAVDSGMKVVSDYYETLKVWDVATGECLKTLEGHPDYVKDVAALHDGATLISACGGIVRFGPSLVVWNLTTRSSPGGEL